jgi:predicted small secreted protein
MDFIKKLVLGSVLLSSFLVMACNNDTSGINAGQDSLMLIHASPDAGPIDFTFNDVKINGLSLTYGQNTGYTLINAGIKKVETTFPPSAVKQVSVPIFLKTKKVYSIFFAGRADSSTNVSVAT